jgi:redox-sensing transcriptional repressor
LTSSDLPPGPSPLQGVHGGHADPPTDGVARQLPPATVARLTLYLRALNTLLTEGTERISSETLADATGASSSNVRKDLSYLGSYGTRGVGYDVQYLSRHISAALGLTHEWRVAIVGAGNLGRALARYAGFESRGFDVVALLDADQMLIGSEIGWLRVSDVQQLEAVLSRTKTNMVVLALPAAVAQEVCDRVVAAGVHSILSFAPVALQVPANVNLRKVDMATELQILAYHAQRMADPALDREDGLAPVSDLAERRPGA